MFLYEKKIVYLTFFWDGVKKSSAGFVKVSRERDACKLDIHIKHIDGLSDGKYALYLVLRDREEEWGSVIAKDAGVDEERSLPVSQGKFRLREREFAEEELCGILIRLGKRQWVSGYWQEVPGTREPGQVHAQALPSEREKVSKQAAEAEKPKLSPETKKEDKREELSFWPGDIHENKWVQLQRDYKKVHPFGDERLYLSIEPKDFIVLQAPYQRLVNNSFLLHGYYNYRHLILGPDEEIGTGDRVCFYLGVPGTYFEREKMVAVMFGFEGFECAGPVEVGKFGYYMRRVEL